VKRLLLFAAVAFASLTAACGGGGSTPSPPPPVGKFTNADLKGQYAFSMSGEDAGGAFIARVGSFFADGNGNITKALEDVNDVSAIPSVNTVSFTGGSYAIQPNGRGTLTLTNALSSLQLSISLISAAKGFMIQTDFNATSSGNFNLQTPASFTQTAVNGNYVFDFSGVDGNNAPISIIGQVKADGAGMVTGGVADVNDGTTGVASAQPVPAAPYQLDPTNGNGATFGRGTSTISGISYVFYIVDNTRIKFIGVSIGDLLGDAVLQTGTIPTQTSNFNPGSFAFLVGGSAVLGTMGPLTRAGRFTTDGSGNLSNIFLDTNNFGSRHSTAPNNVSPGASYAIDATSAVAGSGRGTLTIKDSGLTDAFNYVFYLVSPTQAVIQDVSNGVIADGSMLAQAAGPLTFPSTGNFAFNWSGIILNSSNTIQFEEDFVGQYSPGSPGANGFNGAVDFEELGSSGKNLFTNVPITVSTSINSNVPDGTGPNGYQVVTGNSPSTTFTYRAYIVDKNTVFLMGFDGNQVIAGIVSAQP